MLKKNRPMPSSFASIYDQYADAIYRYAFHCVGNAYDAEDLTAQTFFKALKNFWRFRWTGAPISAWLFRIATNEIHTFFRQAEKTRGIDGNNAETVPSPLATTEEKSYRDLVMKSLSSCMKGLKPQDHSLLVLRYLEKKTFAEISQITGKRVSSLKMRVHRALNHLQTEMEKQGVDHAFFRTAFAKPC